MKTSKKIPDVDFPALLEKAKAVHAGTREEIRRSATLPGIRAAKEKWNAWVKENLADRGIR